MPAPPLSQACPRAPPASRATCRLAFLGWGGGRLACCLTLLRDVVARCLLPACLPACFAACLAGWPAPPGRGIDVSGAGDAEIDHGGCVCVCVCLCLCLCVCVCVCVCAKMDQGGSTGDTRMWGLGGDIRVSQMDHRGSWRAADASCTASRGLRVCLLRSVQP